MIQQKNTSKQTDKLTAQQKRRWSTFDNNTKQFFGTEHFSIVPISYWIENFFPVLFQ